MRIEKMLWQHRRDFKAIFKCEHCEKQEEKTGYDDAYFHEKVIPDMECKNCGKKAGEGYIPRATKYAEHEVI